MATLGNKSVGVNHFLGPAIRETANTRAGVTCGERALPFFVQCHVSLLCPMVQLPWLTAFPVPAESGRGWAPFVRVFRLPGPRTRARVGQKNRARETERGLSRLGGGYQNPPARRTLPMPNPRSARQQLPKP
ncbi:hypothetical protein HRbin30_00982 [bacterium HR30]|nr:hypothetical protein HRbin30_00982 [bacterium HR30]